MKKLLIELLYEYVDKIAYFIPLLNQKSSGIKGFTSLHNDGYLNDEQTISYRFNEGSNILFLQSTFQKQIQTQNHHFILMLFLLKKNQPAIHHTFKTAPEILNCQLAK